jgi:hypothetical protein
MICKLHGSLVNNKISVRLRINIYTHIWLPNFDDIYPLDFHDAFEEITSRTVLILTTRFRAPNGMGQSHPSPWDTFEKLFIPWNGWDDFQIPWDGMGHTK